MHYLLSCLPMITLAAALSFLPPAGAAVPPAHSLTVDEDFTNPLGFHDPSPVFSWKLPDGTLRQSAYQVTVTGTDDGTLWDSGKMESGQSVWVPYGGPPLQSRQALRWTVKFWDESGKESPPSQAATIEMGLLKNTDWSAQWIAAPSPGDSFEWAKVKLIKARYGRETGNPKTVRDVRAQLQKAIDGGRVPMRIVNHLMGGSPAPGGTNTLTVEFEYEGKTHHRKFAERTTFNLDPNPMLAHPGYHFRDDFQTRGPVVKARLHASALGIYQFRINGIRVGDDLLAPGWTSYQKRVETRTYNVTPLLREGRNTIGALLGEGWFAGSLFMRDIATLHGEMPKLLGQLELTYADGTTERVVTNASWRVTRDGPITAAGYYFGEEYDATRKLGRWSEPGYTASGWESPVASPVKTTPLLEPKPMPPVRVMQELSAQSVKRLAPGVFLFDFGQNLVGFPSLKVRASKGTDIGIRVAEMLNQDGTPYTENYRAARARATYRPAADGPIDWEPSLSFFGFRYVELSGLPDAEPPATDAVVAKVIHTAFQRTGTFECSHEKLNQLQRNIRWGQIGNFVDLPTDCPQRDERLGWTGDAQVFLPTSFFNYGVHSFWTRWLQTARDDQKADGSIPFVIPQVGLDGAGPGWSDVIVTAPWDIYERTGDLRVLERNYDAMKRWVGVYQRDAKNGISTMKGFGDWLQPYASNQRGDTPMPVIATAYFGRDARILARTAAVLGKPDEATRFRKLHATIRRAFTREFIGTAADKAATRTQTGLLMALAYDLVEPAAREAVEKKLLAAYQQAGRHLRTGFLGTPLLAPVFDAVGHPEISYELLFKETYPSWFYSINQGATTMWERWNSYSHEDGFGKASMNSFNHYAYGAIGQWMYERVAGLSPDPAHPGYKHFFIRPLVGGRLEWASAALETPYGPAKSAWKLDGNTLIIEAIVPPNTTATVVFPTDNADSIHTSGKAKPVTHADGTITLKVDAGTYRFEVMR